MYLNLGSDKEKAQGYENRPLVDTLSSNQLLHHLITQIQTLTL